MIKRAVTNSTCLIALEQDELCNETLEIASEGISPQI